MKSVSVEHLLRSAVLHHQAGRLGEAEPLYRQVLGAQPGNAHAVHYLGLLLHQKGEKAEALTHLRRAMALAPLDSRYAGNTAQVLLVLGRADEAIELYRKTLTLRPGNADAHHQMGLAYAHLKQYDRAAACYQKAVEIDPNHAAAWNALGLRLLDENRREEAMQCYQRALAADPRLADAHNNIGRLLHDTGLMDEAIAAYERALALNPNSASYHCNLAAAMKDTGELDRALELDRKAVALAPGDARIGSNLLYDMLFHPGVGHAELLAEHAKWNTAFAALLHGSTAKFANSIKASRRLKIGYVSPDFKSHPIGRFMLPLLRHHDRERVEVFCYSDVRTGDGITTGCKSAAHIWRDTATLSDDQLADLICRDGIDILVDLTMHMEGNRLLVFARRPAPIQATYLAYCGTTGLDAIDFRLTDAFLDPPGGVESAYSEKSVRLKSYWCYSAPPDSPDVGPLPFERNGYVTFGSLNNFGKISGDTWEAWIEILRLVRDSHLLIHAREGSHRERAWRRLADTGIDPRRLEFVAAAPLTKYLSNYNRIDIGLDPFPYPGGTTSCDALWMGVPVITLPGKTAISRGGLSVLSNVGMSEWVARDLGKYVELAVRLADDIGRLGQIRSTLRERMLGSRLMNETEFARDIEKALLGMRISENSNDENRMTNQTRNSKSE